MRIGPTFEKAEAEIAAIKAGPKWRLYALLAVLAFLVIYLLWATFKKPAPSTEKFEQTKPAISVAKVAGPLLKVPVKILPAAAVEKKIPAITKKPEEEYVNTGKITPAPYGGTTVDTIDTKTGEVKEQFKPNAAPWFALEDKNYIGGSIGASSLDGYVGRAYFKRDIAQIKEIHLQIEGEAIARPSGPIERKAEFIGWGNVEYRFNGFNPFK